MENAEKHAVKLNTLVNNLLMQVTGVTILHVAISLSLLRNTAYCLERIANTTMEINVGNP